MTMLRGFAVLLAIALFATVAAACDGDGGGTTPQAGDTPQADGGAGDADGDGDTEGEDGDGGDGNGDGADNGDGDGGDDVAIENLAALAGESADGVIAKVTYRITTEVDGETFDGEWVLVQRPPDSRFEIAATEDGQEFRSIIITAGGNSYVCFSGDGEGNCLASETEEADDETAPLDPLFDIPRGIAEGVEDIGLVDSSQRTIAGVDATCFTVASALAVLGEGEVCFSDGGLLLYVRGETDGDTSIFEATSVSTEVTDADFEPPYEIFELPDIGLPES
jgi:hypothetical protein